MAAAVFRDFVALESLEPDSSKDDSYGTGSSWMPYASVWAQVLPLAGTAAGTEAFAQQGVQSRTNYTVTIRYRTDVDATDKLIYRGQPLEILSCVDPDGLRQTLLLQCASYPAVTS